MTLDQARVGKRVAYYPRPGIREEGVITRVGSEYVFVLYDDHLNTGPMATRSVDLQPVHGPRPRRALEAVTQ